MRKIQVIFSLFLLFLFSFPTNSFATHIVGGTLTYVHNGGSNYTITLKLYRDCAGVNLPNNVTITVAGYNGAGFTPSKDFNIGLTSSSFLAANLDSCAQAPSPIPCVQEGVYTTTVNNLPPNPGGYHLYYQLIARNTGITNIDASGNDIGESFYAYIPGTSVYWLEDFTLANGTTTDAGPTAWTRTLGAIPPNSAQVNNNLFEINGANDAEATWTSQVINIAAYPAGVNLSVDLAEASNLENSDSIIVYYSLNGGPLTQFTTNGATTNDFGNLIASETGLIGNTVQIVVRAHYGGNSAGELYRIDNVMVTGNDFAANNSPNFVSFPPLFLCVGNAFTFNHIASDAEGDSLVYSFYTPYDGDNNVGPKDPTFPGNIATFLPVIWLPGFSATNPLGGPALNLNQSTGMLTGTPTMLGQFVVGVKVEEYRNGVYLSEVLRDFQFNIINCPPPAQALIIPGDTLTVCSGNTITFPNNSDTIANNWLWDFGDPFTTNDTSTLEFPTYTYPGVGTYTATLIINAGTSCADTSTATVIVTSPPAAPTVGSNSPICEGSTLNLTASVVAGATYNWTGPNSFSSSLQNPTIPSATVLNAGTYYCTVTVAGCTSAPDSVVVVISPVPATPTANSNSPICEGATLNLTTPAVAGATYSWTGPNSFSSSLQNPSIPGATAAAAGTYNVTVTVAGCTSAAGSVVVVINPTPATPTPSSNSPVCETGTLNLTTPPVVGASYNWTGPNSFTSTLQNPSISGVTPAASGTYYLSITVGGCTSATDSVVVVITPAIIVDANVDQIICAGDVVNLNGSVTGGSTTGIWTTSGTGTFTPTNTTLNATYTPSAADILAGTVTLTLTSTTNGGCTPVVDQMVVTIQTAPTVNAGPDQIICSGSSVTLAGIVTGGAGTGIWTSSGTGTFTPNNTILNATYNPSPADILAGTVTLTLTATNACLAPFDDVVITISPAPTVNAGPDQIVCANNPIVTLSGSVTVGGTQGIWTSSGTGVFAPSNTNLNATYTPSAADILAGTVTIILTSTDGCVAVADTMIVTITPAPIVDAGPDITMCANNVVPLSGSVTGPTTTGSWSTSGTGTFTPNNTTLNATYNPSTADTLAGSVTLTLTSTNNGSCLAVTDQMIITFSPAPAVNAGPNVTVCGNNAIVNLSGTVTGGSSTGIWTSSGSGTFTPNNTTLNATYTPSAADTAAGSVTLTLTSTNNGTCLPTSSQMTITITPSPAVNAGPDVIVCQNLPNVTLSGTVTGGSSTGSWSTSGTGTFTPNNTTLNATYNPSAGDISAGTVTLILTSTANGNCLPVADTMVITITTSPVVNAGPDVTMCANNLVVLAGSVTGFTTTGQWSTSGTGTFVPNNTTLNATYVPSPADTLAGSVTLTLTSTNNASCLPEQDQMVITFTSAPGVNAGADIIVCANNPVANLNGFVSAPFNGLWTTLGSGTFSPSNTTLNATYTLSAGDTAAGSVTLVLESTNNGTCLPVYDTLVITLIAAPIADAGPDQFICIGDSAVMNGVITFGSGTGQWSTTGTGTFIPSNTNLNATYVPSAADYTAGSVFIILTSTNNGTCLAVDDTVLVTFTSPPTVNAGVDQTICENEVVQLAGSVTGTSTTGQWFTSGDGTFVPNNTDLNAQYIPGPNDIAAGTVTITLESTFACLASDQLIITINPGPIVDAGPDQIICITTNQVNLAGVVSGSTNTGIWSTSGTGTFTPSNTTLNGTYNLSAGDSIAGTFMLILTSTNNGVCPASSDTMVVTLTTVPIVNAGPDTTFCANNFANLSGSVVGGASTGQWSTSGTGTFSPFDTVLNALYVPSAADIAAGTVTLTLSSTGACVVITDNVTITITPAPLVNAGNDTTICDSSVVQLNGVITGGSSTGQWSTSGDGIFTPSNTALNGMYTPGANDILNGTFDLYLTSTNNGDCIPEDDTLTVLLLSAPIANAGGDQLVCGGSNVALNGTISGGTGGTWSTLGTGSFVPNNTTLNGTYVPSAGDTAAGSVQLILTSDPLNICGTDNDTITITFVTAPVVDAGLDFSVCANNDTISLTGFTSNGSGLWSTTGDGTFIPTDSLLTTSYVPGPNDIINGQVIFELTTLNVQNCPNVTDTLIVTITPAPLVDAGPDISVCLTNPLVSLSGSITGGSTTGYWSTTGTGTFIPDSLSLTTNYQPSNADTAAGSIIFILTSTNNGNCLPESDTILVTFDAAPTVDAGLDMIACQLDTTMLFATINGGGTTIWSSNGAGTFVPDSAANPVGYLPAASDTAAPVEFIVTYTNGCGSAQDTVLITVLPDPGVSMNYIVDCETFEVQFTAITTGGTIQNINWDFGDGNTDTTLAPTHTYASAGSYNVTLFVTTTDGCTDSISENVTIEPLPIANFIVSDSVVIVGTQIIFNDTSQFASSWVWDFGDGMGPFNVEDTFYTYTTPGTYTVVLIVYNASGCSDTATIDIIVNPDDNVFPPKLPGGFTPNGDGFNDVFLVRGGPFETFNFRIYNEWGNELFKSEDQEDGWDGTYKGKEQPVGVYIYLFEGTTIDGTEYSISSDFSLIR